jgi:hypothetical protein
MVHPRGTQGADVPEIEDCLQQIMAIQGAVGACLIDYPSGSTIGAAGGVPAGDDQHTTRTVRLLHATVEATAFATVGRPASVENVVITTGDGYHLVHPLADGFGGRLVLYLRLDRTRANLALTQRSLHAIGDRFAVG